ncbi:hypothetical protein LTR37_001613 [Vermiconidia calcicola]|uniref:Uncharacterized protein n=1 Tax=Vermiconidia calcicola TaxID=1690605 RepID=A0ACC3NW89_9PEZI|nr:hypothetical protein LTR37_001613 [Vermiconidia calcicola]
MSRLLTLPAELRNRIYDFALPNGETLLYQSLSPPLSRTCSILRKETFSIFRANNTFIGYLSDFTSGPSGHSPLQTDAQEFGDSFTQKVDLIKLFCRGEDHKTFDHHNESGLAVHFKVRGEEFEWEIREVVRKEGEFRIQLAPLQLLGDPEVIADAMKIAANSQATMEEILGRKLVQRAAIVGILSGGVPRWPDLNECADRASDLVALQTPDGRRWEIYWSTNPQTCGAGVLEEGWERTLLRS